MTSGNRTPDADPAVDAGQPERPRPARRRGLIDLCAIGIIVALGPTRPAAAAESTAGAGAATSSGAGSNSGASSNSSAGSGPGADWNLGRLLTEMSQRKKANARFAERQFLSLLDTPVDSSGELLFEAPGRLEKRTLKPRAELLAVNGDEMRVERPGLNRTMSLQQMPEAAALIESLRATLNGDQQALEKVFQVALTGPRDKWQMVLTPRDAKASAIVRRITLTGVRNDLQVIETEQNDGDRSVMRILDSR